MPREKTFTEADVERAIKRLKKAGRLISNRSIREIIGSGSFTTIAEVRNNHPEWESGEPKEPITLKIRDLENQVARLTEQVAGLAEKKEELINF